MEQVVRGPFTALVPAAPRDLGARAGPHPQAPHLPVVALMGWAGATDRPLSKYAAFLAGAGFASVRFTLPTPALFSAREGARRRLAADLLAFLADTGLCPPRRLVLLAFSNGGAFVVEQLALLARPEDAALPPAAAAAADAAVLGVPPPLRGGGGSDCSGSDDEGGAARAWLPPGLVAGVVFDSAPAFITPGLGPRVLQSSMPPGWRRALAVAACRAVEAVAPSLLFGGDRPQVFWRRMLRLVDWPQAFLYSADDPLCDAAALAALVAAKRAAGQPVRVERCWEASQHCGHFVVHREEYARLLLGFLHGVAAENGGGGEPEPLGAPWSRL